MSCNESSKETATAAETAPRFPRGKDLPTQSPRFWAAQKDRYLRQLLIRDIEELTGRRLVDYYANRFENAQIDGLDSIYMSELLGDAVDQPVDLMVETAGGQTDATEALISLIHNLTNDVRVVVANAAKSNGTLLALAAKSIFIGATSELGPIEPQVQGIPTTILAEPQIASQNFVLHKAGVYALQQTVGLAKRLLSLGMMKDKTEEELDHVVSKLSTRQTYASHGSVIDYKETLNLGLYVEYLSFNDPLWSRIWLLYCMYEHDCRKAPYLKVFEGRSRSTAISIPTAPPAN